MNFGELRNSIQNSISSEETAQAFLIGITLELAPDYRDSCDLHNLDRERALFEEILFLAIKGKPFPKKMLLEVDSIVFDTSGDEYLQEVGHSFLASLSAHRLANGSTKIGINDYLDMNAAENAWILLGGKAFSHCSNYEVLEVCTETRNRLNCHIRYITNQVTLEEYLKFFKR